MISHVVTELAHPLLLPAEILVVGLLSLQHIRCGGFSDLVGNKSAETAYSQIGQNAGGTGRPDGERAVVKTDLRDQGDGAEKRGKTQNRDHEPNLRREMGSGRIEPLSGKSKDQQPERYPQEGKQQMKRVFGQRRHVHLKNVQPDHVSAVFCQIIERDPQRIDDQRDCCFDQKRIGKKQENPGKQKDQYAQCGRSFTG